MFYIFVCAVFPVYRADTIYIAFYANI